MSTNDPRDHEILHRLDQVREDISELRNDLKYQLKRTSENEADIKWVKGYIKFSISAIISLVGAVIAGFISLFKTHS